MPDKSWKAVERRLAKDMGGRRIPVTGERHGADVETGLFCFQIKCRKVLPVWLWRWLDGIVLSAQNTNRIGCLVLKRPRQQDEDALVILRWKDWVSLHGTPKDEEAA